MACRGMRRGHLGSPDLLASPGFGSRPRSRSVGSWKNEVSGQWSFLLSSWPNGTELLCYRPSDGNAR
jgi:hypothetical protein